MGSNPTLSARAFRGLAQLLVAVAIVLFAGAGTFEYWQGWGFLLVFGTATMLITAYFLRADPALIEARLRAGPGAEKRRSQRVIQSFASLFFLALLLVPSLDRRFGWSAVPPAIVVLGDIAVLVGLTIVFFVFRENTYTSGIIEVREDQRLVSTGPYRIVRHPMYAGALLMLGFIPLALGSFVALVFFVPMLVVIVWRLVDEEHHLAERLAGYEDYRRKTRYRLVPLVW